MLSLKSYQIFLGLEITWLTLLILWYWGHSFPDSHTPLVTAQSSPAEQVVLPVRVLMCGQVLPELTVRLDGWIFYPKIIILQTDCMQVGEWWVVWRYLTVSLSCLLTIIFPTNISLVTSDPSDRGVLLFRLNGISSPCRTYIRINSACWKPLLVKVTHNNTASFNPI